MTTAAPSSTAPLTQAVRWSLPWATGKKALRPAFYDALVQWTPSGTATASTRARKPVNLSIVIDKSGSMDDTLDGQGTGSYRRMARPVLPIPPAPVEPFRPWVLPTPPVQPWPGIPGSPWDNQPMWLAQPTVTHVNDQLLMNATSSQAPDRAAALDHLDAYQLQVVAEEETPRTKLSLTIEAAWAAVQTLTAKDRVSIVSFDDEVKTVCSGVAGSEKAVLRRALDSIVVGGTTALFDGWAQGARLVAEAMQPGSLNRVIVLTDGRANRGERSRDRIASRLAELADAGVSTTTFGMGKDYDEDMLQAMAQAGDGNYYYIRGTDDFLTLFEDEFNGIAHVAGRKVRARVETDGWDAAPDLLNEFLVDADGWSRLPNLMRGQTLSMVVRLKPGKTVGTLRVRLCYEDVDGTPREQVLDAAMPSAKDPGTPDQAVVDLVASLLVAREKKKAVAALDRGDLEMATSTLRNATAYMAGASASLVNDSTVTLNALATGMEAGDQVTMRKSALYQTYNTRSGKSR